MQEPLLLEYHNDEGLLVVEEHLVPVHCPRIRTMMAVCSAMYCKPLPAPKGLKVDAMV